MLRLGSIGKTSIDVDISFLILVAFFVATYYNPRQGIEYALLWIPILFLSVLLHELAHAAMIAIFGFGGSSIVLAGMGGVTINERRARPWQDMLISLAGPAASFAIAWICALVSNHIPYARQDPALLAFLPLMYSANIAWGIFNLFPVPPLDGGQAVRNFFRTFLDERKAFVGSVWIAIVVGTLIAVAALLARWFFLGILMAWYVWTNWQAWTEYRQRGFPGD